MKFAAARRRLLEELVRTRGRASERVLEAMADVPRHRFVDEALWARAYSDDALPIGHGQTISKPSTVLRMTEALELTPGDRVLEVGSGSGYQAAVLGRLAAVVHGVERIPPLVVRARRTLHELGIYNVHLRPGDGALGWAEAAPFDAVLVAAAATAVPAALLQQLRPGGRLVLPLAGSSGQSLRRLVCGPEGSWREEVLEECRFVPLVSCAVS